MSYQKTESLALSQIKKAIPLSLKQNIIKETKGLFAELYESSVFPDYYLACSIDGVGTKLLIASALNRFDTIGIDLVAMCANDLATLGNVQPFLFMDYLAVQEKIELRAGEIITGISKGLELCDTSGIFRNDIKINFGKGETASITEMLDSFKDGFGYDIAGAMIGFMPRNADIKEILPGDRIIAIKSSGLHSNGYTDARKYLLNGDFETRKHINPLYKGKYCLTDKVGGRNLGDILLEPTRIYSKSVAEIARRFKVIGVNNTGNGLKNFNRFNANAEFFIDNPPEPPDIFRMIQQSSGFKDMQMYQTFNMGMGFFLIVSERDANNIVNCLKEMNEDAWIVGNVNSAKNTHTILVKGKNRIVFEGY